METTNGPLKMPAGVVGMFVRLPALISAFLVWFILSREILPRFGDLVNGRRVDSMTDAKV